MRGTSSPWHSSSPLRGPPWAGPLDSGARPAVLTPALTGGSALITGGAGFIGSHLARALLNGGWRVHVLDDLSTGRLENILPLEANPHFAFTVDSALKRAAMAPLVTQADVVFHLAAAVGVRL